MIAEDNRKLEEKIKYEFKDRALLTQALTHSSFSNEQKINRQKNYERLEFLGDAVLELTASKFFFQKEPEMTEGEMTRMRSYMVCESALAFCARGIGLGDYLFLGKGEEATGGRDRDSILGDVVEALIGALYLDGGFEAAESFIMEFVLSDLENKQLFLDSKSILQEKAQKSGMTVTYRVLEETGPDHRKQFTVEAYLNEEAAGRGVGRTKKAAEQTAAYAILTEWEK